MHELGTYVQLLITVSFSFFLILSFIPLHRFQIRLTCAKYLFRTDITFRAIRLYFPPFLTFPFRRVRASVFLRWGVRSIENSSRLRLGVNERAKGSVSPFSPVPAIISPPHFRRTRRIHAPLIPASSLNGRTRVTTFLVVPLAALGRALLSD